MRGGSWAAICSRRRLFGLMPLRRRCGCTCRRIVVVFLCMLLGLTFILWRRARLVPLYVVEEHHEALLYWFHAIDHKLLPSEKYTLIHIDGHSDECTPQYIPGVPRFTLPKNENEMALLLQRNDVFIQAAVMTGLISHVVWIWPSWDLDLMARNVTFKSTTVELGWYINSTSESDVPTLFCQCEVTTGTPDDNPRCSYVNVTENDAEKRDVDIPRRLCRVVTSYRSEHVNEHVALQRLKSEEDVPWLGSHANVIVDIDEDFFGCESASRQLVETDMTWKLVEDIDAKLESFLCPKHIGHEGAADEFLRRIARSLDDACSRSTAGECRAEFRAALRTTEKGLLQQFLRRPSMFCGENDLQVRNAWHDVASNLYNLTSDQFRRVIRLGFCLSGSPKTVSFNDGNGAITICHGINEPDSNVVFLHTPSAVEVAHRMRTLREILRSLPTRPKLATLCRSVRDGYTPRNLSKHIERGILRLFAEWKGWEVFYDDDLLGGRVGWEGRPPF